ncbi:MAG: nucleotidyl transferase AbiEii/AbiGii toxin family protein [Dehalococcoidia bacterium]
MEFALVGGLAVSVRTEPRFTRDADLAVAVADDEAAEATIRHLLGRGFKLTASLEQELTGRLATVRLIAPSPEDEGAVVDFLFASCGIEPEIVAGASVEEIVPDVTMPVATIGHLIAMKSLSERPERFQDSVDLLALIQASSADDLGVARKMLDLIAQRGANRGKDLNATLDRYIQLAKTPEF